MILMRSFLLIRAVSHDRPGPPVDSRRAADGDLEVSRYGV